MVFQSFITNLEIGDGMLEFKDGVSSGILSY